MAKKQAQLRLNQNNLQFGSSNENVGIRQFYQGTGKQSREEDVSQKSKDGNMYQNASMDPNQRSIQVNANELYNIEQQQYINRIQQSNYQFNTQFAQMSRDNVETQQLNAQNMISQTQNITAFVPNSQQRGPGNAPFGSKPQTYAGSNMDHTTSRSKDGYGVQTQSITKTDDVETAPGLQINTLLVSSNPNQILKDVPTTGE